MREVSLVTRVAPRIALFATVAVTAAACSTGNTPTSPSETVAQTHEAITSSFSTGFESADPQPTWNSTIDWSSNVSGYSSGINPECAGRTGEQAHTGSSALMYSGSAAGAASDYVYFKVFSVNFPISSTSVLDYWIFPQQDNGRYVAVDFHCTDGTTLRDSGAVDQNGFSVHPGAGHGGNITLRTWAEVPSPCG